MLQNVRSGAFLAAKLENSFNGTAVVQTFNLDEPTAHWQFVKQPGGPSAEGGGLPFCRRTDYVFRNILQQGRAGPAKHDRSALLTRWLLRAGPGGGG